MTKTRGEISEIATSLLQALDQFKSYYRCSHEDMLHAIAAAMAQMPEEDRARFRQAFDQIEEEMSGDSPKGSRNRLSRRGRPAVLGEPLDRHHQSEHENR